MPEISIATTPGLIGTAGAEDDEAEVFVVEAAGDQWRAFLRFFLRAWLLSFWIRLRCARLESEWGAAA